MKEEKNDNDIQISHHIRLFFKFTGAYTGAREFADTVYKKNKSKYDPIITSQKKLTYRYMHMYMLSMTMTQISHRKKRGSKKKGGGAEKIKLMNKLNATRPCVNTSGKKSISSTIRIGREIKLFLKTNYHKMFCILFPMVPAFTRPMRESA